MKRTNKIYPKIQSYEHIVSYKSNKNGKMKKTIDLTKKLNGKHFLLKGKVNGKSIHITKKVRVPIDIISPNTGAITSKKNSFRPHGILKQPHKKLIKTYKNL